MYTRVQVRAFIIRDLYVLYITLYIYIYIYIYIYHVLRLRSARWNRARESRFSANTQNSRMQLAVLLPFIDATCGESDPFPTR